MDNNLMTQTLFWLITASFGILVSLIGYISARALNKNEKEMDKLKQDIESNKNIIDGRLETILNQVQSSLQDLTKGIYEMREVIGIFKSEHTGVKRSIRAMDFTLKKHETRIQAVESDCKHNHK